MPEHCFDVVCNDFPLFRLALVEGPDRESAHQAISQYAHEHAGEYRYGLLVRERSEDGTRWKALRGYSKNLERVCDG